MKFLETIVAIMMVLGMTASDTTAFQSRQQVTPRLTTRLTTCPTVTTSQPFFQNGSRDDLPERGTETVVECLREQKETLERIELSQKETLERIELSQKETKERMELLHNETVARIELSQKDTVARIELSQKGTVARIELSQARIEMSIAEIRTSTVWIEVLLVFGLGIASSDILAALVKAIPK
jgi:hypothetical protein